mgnify:CR=1 FL=1
MMNSNLLILIEKMFKRKFISFFLVKTNTGDFMRIRLGYACVSETINVTTSSTYTYSSFLLENDIDKLDNIINSNLEALDNLIDYNIKNNIHFFRLSSKIIPLATIVDFDYLEKYKSYYEKIGKKIKVNNMRIDFHPDQFTVLNSVKSEVIDNTFNILKYHYNLLDYLNIDKKVLVLHVGSSVFGKEKSIERFIYHFNKLPDYLKSSIVIENDDKIYNIDDCMRINKIINTPVVLDYHHHLCNKSSINFLDVFSTWKNINPKVHFSSPKSKLKKEFRSHNDYINSDDFICFLEQIKNLDFDIDIMIEAKKKDEALFRLVRELKYKTNYKFIDETTFFI